MTISVGEVLLRTVTTRIYYFVRSLSLHQALAFFLIDFSSFVFSAKLFDS